MKNYENLLKKKVYCDKISFVDKKSTKRIFLDSSMVEHTAVNRGVVGSSPTRGVVPIFAKQNIGTTRNFCKKF